jgi:hypothetical protein
MKVDYDLLLVEILKGYVYSHEDLLREIKTNSEWWQRITKDNPDVIEIIRRWHISLLY